MAHSVSVNPFPLGVTAGLWACPSHADAASPFVSISWALLCFFISKMPCFSSFQAWRFPLLGIGVFRLKHQAQRWNQVAISMEGSVCSKSVSLEPMQRQNCVCRKCCRTVAMLFHLHSACNHEVMFLVRQLNQYLNEIWKINPKLLMLCENGEFCTAWALFKWIFASFPAFSSPTPQVRRVMHGQRSWQGIVLSLW